MRPLVSIVAGLMMMSTPFAAATAQDVEMGEQIYRQCRACHQIGDSARNLVGPLLNGIVGRKAGTIEGFNYSQSNKDAGAGGLVWTEDNLLKYLENPMAFMPGTKMTFAGVKAEDARRDLIAYLKKFPQK
jgi:cytochrome c